MWTILDQQTRNPEQVRHVLQLSKHLTCFIHRSLFPSRPANGLMGAGPSDGVCTLCFLLRILSALRRAQATWQHIAAPLIRSNSQSKQTTAAYGRHISSSSLTQTLTSHFHEAGGGDGVSKPRTETVRSCSTKPGTEFKQPTEDAETDEFLTERHYRVLQNKAVMMRSSSSVFRVHRVLSVCHILLTPLIPKYELNVAAGNRGSV